MKSQYWLLSAVQSSFDVQHYIEDNGGGLREQQFWATFVWEWCEEMCDNELGDPRNWFLTKADRS